MTIKTRTKVLIPAAILFCLLYIVFAMRQLETELSFTPEWTEDISHVKNKSADDILIPYKLSQTIGYFTPDGKIVCSIPYPSKASISEKYYAVYAENNKNAKVYNNLNSFVTNLDYSGFPFFDEDRIFVFLPGGCSFIQCNENGGQMWRYEYFSPVTSFSSSKGGSAAGFADGTICTFDEKGNIKNQFTPGGSRIPVILGIDISDDGEMTACICGQEKQRFVLSKKDGEHNKIIYHEYLEQDQSRQVLVKFNRKNDTVYYDANNSLGIVDLNNLKSSKFPVKGSVIQIEEAESDGLVFVLSREGKTYTVSVFEPLDSFLGSFSFESKSAFLQVYENALFVGRDTKISRVTVSRK